MGGRRRHALNFGIGLGLGLWLAAGFGPPAPASEAPPPARFVPFVAAARAQVTEARKAARAEAAAVRLDGRPVLVVAPAAGLTARERADFIEERLVAIVAAPGPEPAWRLEAKDGAYDLYAGERFVMSVAAADLVLTPGTPLSQLAHADRTRLEHAVEQARTERSWPYRVRQLGLALLLTVLAVLCAWGASRAYRLGRRTFEGRAFARRPEWARRVPISDTEVRPLLVGLLRWGLWGVWLGIAGAWLVWVLGLFPATRPWASGFFALLERSVSKILQGIVAFLPQLLSIALILLLTYYAVRLIQLIFERLARNPQAAGFDTSPELMRATGQLLSLLTWLFAIMIIAPMLPGLGTQTGQALALIFGAAITLGSTTVVGNAMAGFTLLLMRPFDVGDRVLVGDVEGDVVDRRFTTVRLLTLKNELVSFTSLQVLNQPIINYSASAAQHGGVAISTEATIGYDVPRTQVEALFLAAAARTEGVLEAPPPIVLVQGFRDHAVAYALLAGIVDVKRRVLILSALNQHVLDVFAEAGVEILSPSYHALRDGNAATLPPAHQPPGYEAPPFRFWQVPRWPPA